MAEFSNLNGYDVKDKKAIRTFDTVADMKADTNLKVGQCVATLGYYSVNDGGGAEYVIEDSLIENNSTIVKINNEKYASLIIKDRMNVKQFGVKGDGLTDDTDNFIIAVQVMQNRELFISNCTILINSPIELQDNKISGIESEIKAMSTFDNINYMIKLLNNNYLQNIKFNANNIVRQITTESNVCDKIEIIDCDFTGCCRYVHNETDKYSLNYCVALDAKKLIIKNSKIHDNYGHGLRLYQTQTHATVLIDNCEFYNNGVINGTKVTTALGLVQLGRASGNFDSVIISNCVAYNNANTGFGVHSAANCTIINCNSYNNKEHGYCLMDGENGKILNCNSSNNSSYGFRIQGDYGQVDGGYKNFIIKNCISQNEGNIYVSNKIDTGIIEDNILYCKTGYGFCMTIGENNSTEKISNLTITNNRIISNYENLYPIAFYVPNNGSNYVFNNYINGEVMNGNNYKTDFRFIDKNNELKYGETNNILASPDNFSSSWYVIGTLGSDNHTLTPNASSGYIAQQLVTLNKINPKYISVIVSFNNPNHITLEPQILLRDDQGGTTNLGYFERIVENMDENQTIIGRIIDVSKLGIEEGVNIGKVGVRLRTLPGTSNSIYINYVYVALSNELPIIPVN